MRMARTLNLRRSSPLVFVMIDRPVSSRRAVNDRQARRVADALGVIRTGYDFVTGAGGIALGWGLHERLFEPRLRDHRNTHDHAALLAGKNPHRDDRAGMGIAVRRLRQMLFDQARGRGPRHAALYRRGVPSSQPRDLPL